MSEVVSLETQELFRNRLHWLGGRDGPVELYFKHGLPVERATKELIPYLTGEQLGEEVTAAVLPRAVEDAVGDGEHGRFHAGLRPA